MNAAIDHLCRTCSHVTTAPGNAAHYKVGLRNCNLIEPHRFVGGHHTCEKWSAKQC